MAFTSHRHRYDIFLSFSGEDISRSFTDHLYEALRQGGIHNLGDNDKINRGQDFKAEIKSEIIASRAYIVVLSEKYAYSRWCLDELCLILEQRRKSNRFVLPLFYHVDRSDVKNQNQRELLKLANLTGIEENKGSNLTKVDVRRWKAALTKVADLIGIELSDSESETEFIKETVETVQWELDLNMSTPTHLVAFASSSTSRPNRSIASTSSDTPRPIRTCTTTYDVFLSFRGEDTRHAFTDHLYHALLRAGLRTFKHSDEIDRAQELSTEIKTAIIESRASIIVFSENYANSKWCLDGLCLILEQRRKCNHFVLPVFYHVNPSCVRNQRGSFAIDGSKWTVDNVKQWKAALAEMANLTGKVLQSPRSETNFIAEVVEAVSSSRPNRTYTSKYDIFLSFRGEDTRHTFTDHLYHSLLRARLHTFIDNNAIKRGQELKPEIETAIMEARGSVVVLSKNYANSRWCLDELCLILEQRRKCGHFVLPIFYDVEPSDVREQSRSLAVDGSNWTVDDVRRWKAALTEVADLTAAVLLSGSETDFIAKVIDKINCQLDLNQVIIPEMISSWLKDEQSNTNILAICGMGGSGKTTMAKHIYNAHKQDFESSSFLEGFGEPRHFPWVVYGLQKQLLRDVCGKEIEISNFSEHIYKIEKVLQKKKVLIVLDDIDDKDMLTCLVGTAAFPTQAKIIITRHLSICTWYGSISWRCWVHEIKFLNDLEALKLLSLHAFGSKVPKEGFEELSVQLAQYCGGNPLALKVLGSSLFVSDEDSRTINSMIGIWRCAINSHKSLKGHLHVKMQVVLQKSFDSLPCESHRALFLDIACFFVGESKHMVTTLLEDYLHAEYGIVTLINRCLLTVSPYGELMMHPLLQELGRMIVTRESRDPAKRSRVWHDEDSYYLLRKGDGSHTIERLALDMRKVEQRTGSELQSLAIKTSSLAKMINLKLLQLKYVKLIGSYKNFPDLRWLCWHGFTLKTIPKGLLTRSLVALDMAYGCLEKFKVPMVLNSLKILNLKNVTDLSASTISGDSLKLRL